MRDSGRWHLTDMQRFLVVLAFSSALFLSAMSLGMQNVELLLVALVLVVFVGLGVFMLGLRYSGRAATAGTALVMAVQARPPGRIVANCAMHLLVEVPGRRATPVRVRAQWVPTIKWPRVGMVLPIELPSGNPRDLRVMWELIEPGHTRVPSSADERAAFAVPFFMDYAEGAPEPDAQPYARPGPEPDADGGGPSIPRPRRRPAEAGADPDDNAGPAEPYDQAGAEPGPDAQRDARAGDRPGAPHGDQQTAVGVLLVVSDLDRSLRFYRDMVGFTLVEHEKGTAVLALGNLQVSLHEVVDMAPVDRRNVRLHIPTSDVDATHRDLRSRGVEFTNRPRPISRTARLELWAATFCDPDGNASALTEWRDRGVAPPRS